MNSPTISQDTAQMSFARRAFIASLIFVAVLAGAGLLWLTAYYVLLFFAAVLMAVLLDAIAEGVGHILPIPRIFRLLTSILLFIGAFAALGLAVPSILEQAPQFAQFVEGWVEWALRGISEWAPVQQSLEDGNSSNLINLLPDPAGILGGAAHVLGSVFGAITGIALILIVGLYLAAEPARYYDAALKLFTPEKRPAFEKIASDANMVLRRWLFAQIVMMLIIGVSSYIVLSLLSVPLALLLSFIAGLTAFVPYIGPIVGGGLMVLVAATQDLTLGLIVFGFYLVLQLVEDYVLYPMIQSRAIFVPPVLVILAQVLFGVLGIVLATPLAAMTGVVVSRLYFHESVKEHANA